MKLSSLSLRLVSLALVEAIPSLLSRSTPATINDGILANLRYYAQWAGASYCNSKNAVGQKIVCADDVCPTVGSESTSTVVTLDGLAMDIEGFLATDSTKGIIVISIKGSTSWQNYVTDFVFDQVPCDFTAGCEAHQGFYEAYTEVIGPVQAAVQSSMASNPSYSLIVTGHSLGAAVATLIAAQLRVAGYPCDLYTYGSPRVGNLALAGFVTAQPDGNYRVTHLDDPVTRLPPIIFGFAHTSPEFWLSDGTATTVDYGVEDIKLCTGTRNVSCNAGTIAIDGEAHGYYLEDIDMCGKSNVSSRDPGTLAPDVEEQLKTWAKMDQDTASQC